MTDKTYTQEWEQNRPKYNKPPLLEKRPPRCPPYFEIDNSDQLLPYLEAVAKRPYNHGLHTCWDLQKNEKVLLRVDNWTDPMVIEACQKVLEKFGCKYEIREVDKGPIKEWVGADEVDYYLERTLELAPSLYADGGWRSEVLP